MEENSCYAGGSIASAIIGSLIGGILLAYVLNRLYVKYWQNRKANQLVREDAENVKQEYAFDNPALRYEKSVADSDLSRLDTKWSYGMKTTDERHAVVNSYHESSQARSVSLCGSDFTGLGIEICGGLKEGIYVKKVMSQGPAASNVRVGDRIINIKIDLLHMVPKDAATILSCASPYNVQLEIIDGAKTYACSKSTMAMSSAKTAPSIVSDCNRLLNEVTDQDTNVEFEQINRRDITETCLQKSSESIENYHELKTKVSTVVDGENCSIPCNSTSAVLIHEEQKECALDKSVTAPDLCVSNVSETPPDANMPITDMSTTIVSMSESIIPIMPPVVIKRTKYSKTTADIKHPEKETEPDADDSAVPLYPQTHCMNELPSNREVQISTEIPDQIIAAANFARTNRKSHHEANQMQPICKDNKTTPTSSISIIEPMLEKDPEMASGAVTEATRRPNYEKMNTNNNRKSELDITSIVIDSEQFSMSSTPEIDDPLLESHTLKDLVNDIPKVVEKINGFALGLSSIPVISSAVRTNTNNFQNGININLQQIEQTTIESSAYPNKSDGSVSPSANYEKHELSPEPPKALPRSSVVSLDFSIVENVLADGFSQDTQAALSRQLSELNEDYDQRQLSSTGNCTFDEMPNNYKFAAIPIMVSGDSSQYQLRNEVNDSKYIQPTPISPEAIADIADNGDNTNVGETVGINIPDDVKVSRIGTVQKLNPAPQTFDAIDDDLLSSGDHGINVEALYDTVDQVLKQAPRSHELSSMVSIDDEQLDFDLMNLPITPTTLSASTNDTFIAMNNIQESTIKSQPTLKTPTIDSNTELHQHNNISPDGTTFVHQQASGNNNTKITTVSSVAAHSNNINAVASAGTNKLPSPPRPKQRSLSALAYNFPRNTDIKFTTSTYDATKRQPVAIDGGGSATVGSGLNVGGGTIKQQRSPAVDQVRSTFERGHTQSEIPVLVRRPSIPTSPPVDTNLSDSMHSQSTLSLSSLQRVSPSKIPVFNMSSIGGVSINNSSSTKTASIGSPAIARPNGLYRSHSSLNPSPSSAGSTGRAQIIPVNANGVVTVSAIKYSSRNPSGQ